MKKYHEIIWFGRGGQGAITASKLIAGAAHHEGYQGITTSPTFGAERRGAPVSASLKLSREQAIKSFSAVTDPDIMVILDPTLVPILNLEKRFNHDATVIVNSTKTPEELNLSAFKKVATADITRVALENGLTNEGMTILNTPILGAFVKATGLVTMDGVKESIYTTFSSARAEKNYKTAEIIYNSTNVIE